MISVEQAVNINDPTIHWFRIPGFPGYEISNTNYVRSFKSRKKYPYGTLVKWNKGSIELSNRNNQRVKLTLNEIMELIKTEPECVCHTWEVQNTSRNPMAGIDADAIVTVGEVVHKPKVRNSEDHKFVDFSNIPDIDLNNFV